jgi:hypothetical protein
MTGTGCGLSSSPFSLLRVLEERNLSRRDNENPELEAIKNKDGGTRNRAQAKGKKASTSTKLETPIRKGRT